MKRYVVVENTGVAVFKNYEELGEEQAIFPSKDIDQVAEAVKEKYGGIQIELTDFSYYRKGDVLEKELTQWEQAMLTYRLLEERTIQESIKIQDGTVDVK